MQAVRRGAVPLQTRKDEARNNYARVFIPGRVC